MMQCACPLAVGMPCRRVQGAEPFTRALHPSTGADIATLPDKVRSKRRAACGACMEESLHKQMGNRSRGLGKHGLICLMAASWLPHACLICRIPVPCLPHACHMHASCLPHAHLICSTPASCPPHFCLMPTSCLPHACLACLAEHGGWMEYGTGHGRWLSDGTNHWYAEPWERVVVYQ